MEPLMKLKSLLKDEKNVLVKSALNPEVLGISSHSKAMKPFELYVAYKGASFDGRDFIEEAYKSKALGVITDIYNPLLDKKFIQIITKDPKALAQRLCLKLYGTLDYLVGVTGTNGKTTVSFCVKQLLEALDKPCGLVGTCLIDTIKKVEEANLTTPCGILLSRYIHETKQALGNCLVTEVSSHALDQKRILGHEFDTVIFTNLTHDHLDYHKTFEAYGEAKLKLFLKDYMKKEGGFAVINLDDPFSKIILEKTERKVLTYSLKDETADFFLKDMAFSEEGFKGTLIHNQKSYALSSHLIGTFNAYNILAAIMTAYIYTHDLEKVIAHLSAVTGAPGRLEKVTRNIYIDYAHTPDGLESLLQSIKKLPFKKIRLVFGCGGDRDKEKRPLMGKIAETLADEIIVTSDNPRHEEPGQIIAQILSGMQKKAQVFEDRKEALEYAAKDLDKDTVLIVAGKGHEKKQQIGSISIPFDEKKILSLFFAHELL
jgi:UDP-N-acetylmuramoyl-L-alanyl-D-glutamate--2,6-diaminopimelate ligase